MVSKRLAALVLDLFAGERLAWRLEPKVEVAEQDQVVHLHLEIGRDAAETEAGEDLADAALAHREALRVRRQVRADEADGGEADLQAHADGALVPKDIEEA
eukprot:5787984-Pleurochrysis_carterae.AAC.14